MSMGRERGAGKGGTGPSRRRPREGSAGNGRDPQGPKRRYKINEHRILRAIQASGPCSRADLVRRMGLSAPTVSKVAAVLLEAGFLEEFDAPELHVGRPPKKLRLARERSQVLGIVIATRRSWVISTGLDGALDADRMRKIRTPETYDELISILTEEAKRLMDRPGVETLGAGICVPGLVDLASHVSVLATSVPMIVGRSPAGDLAERLGVPCATLPANHALCLAESRFGDARAEEEFVLLDLSTGASLGMVNRGRLIEGKNGFAGELGHFTIDPRGPRCVCGNHGCLVALASDVAVAAHASNRLGRDVDVEEAVELVRAGELDLAEEIQDVVFYLSIAVAGVVNLLNPSTFVLHGRLFDLAEDLFPRVIEEAGRRALRPPSAACRFVRAEVNQRQGAVAAILEYLIESWLPRAGKGRRGRQAVAAAV